MLDKATAIIVFEDGTSLLGYGFGAETSKMGEVCFNTAMSGYQEILTDPSYKGQIINFTFPHIGNVGINELDYESALIQAEALITRELLSEPSNWRSNQPLHDWLTTHNIPAICGIDTRALTKKIRDTGNIYAVIEHRPNGNFDIEALQQKLRNIQHLDGLDLVPSVTCEAKRNWQEGFYDISQNAYNSDTKNAYKVAVIDYGVKNNILRCLTHFGCNLTIFPATATIDDVMAIQPDGIFLSNGPGDPLATGTYAVPFIQECMQQNIPVFGICLGHQMLALALGATTKKMDIGHRGANHPIQYMKNSKVYITSQNHGFVVDKESLPDNVEPTHYSLFDGSLAGIKVKDKPIFSVQYHPEASPGPQDSYGLFEQFVAYMQ